VREGVGEDGRGRYDEAGRGKAGRYVLSIDLFIARTIAPSL